VNGPAITAVVLGAVALVVVGFVVTLLILNAAPARRWRNTTDAGDYREVDA
jgi:hypothetical protein